MVGLREAPVVAGAAEAPDSGAAGKVVKSSTQRVKRLERPDKAALEQEVEKKRAEVAALQARIAEINKVLQSKHENKHAISQKFAEARSRQAELNNEFRTLVDQKKAVRDELELANKAREQMRGEARAMRDKLQFVKLDQIDEEVKRLEYRMSHTSMSLSEEKKLIQQIKELTKSREYVNQYNELLEHINEDEGSRSAYLEKINSFNELLNEVKEKQELQKKVLTEIKQKETAEGAEVPLLHEEKKSAYEQTKALAEEIRVLRHEHRVKEDEYWQREREFKDQQFADRKRNYEKREAERKEREAFRKQKELENFVEPFTDELILCDQLSSYLQKYVTPAGESHLTSAAVQAEFAAPEGMVVSSKKSDGDLDGWFAGCGGGKGKGKKTRAPAPLRNKDKERITLSVDALSSFAKIKLSPPSTVGDVTKSLEDVKVAKDKFLALQVEARDAREKKAQQGDAGLLKSRVSNAVNGAAVNAFDGSEDGVDAAQGEHGNGHNVSIDGVVEEELGILEVPEADDISSTILEFPPLRPEKVANGKGPARDGSGLEVPQETADTTSHELQIQEVEKQKDGIVEPVGSSQASVKLAEPELGIVEVTDLGLTISEPELSITEPELGIVEVAEDDLGIVEVGNVLKQEPAAVNLDNSKLDAVETGEVNPPPVAAEFVPEVAAADAA